MLAPLVLIAYVALAVGVTVIQGVGWHLYDAVWVIALGALFGYLTYRVGSVKAVPSEEGLTVRNIFHTRFYPWNFVISAALPLTSSWTVLDLSDGTTASVMAIQHSDGGRAVKEIARLRRLIETHTKGEQ